MLGLLGVFGTRAMLKIVRENCRSSGVTLLVATLIKTGYKDRAEEGTSFGILAQFCSFDDYFGTNFGGHFLLLVRCARQEVVLAFCPKFPLTVGLKSEVLC